MQVSFSSRRSRLHTDARPKAKPPEDKVSHGEKHLTRSACSQFSCVVAAKCEHDPLEIAGTFPTPCAVRLTFQLGPGRRSARTIWPHDVALTRRPGQVVCAERGVGLEIALVDLVSAQFLADASAREAAVPGTQLDSTAIFFQDALQVGAFDPAGELGRDLGEGAAVIEVETERLVVAGDDLRGQVFGFDHGTGGGDGRLFDHVLELAYVARPVVGQERERAGRENVLTGRSRSASLSRKWSTRSGMSSSRSRNGGTRSRRR